MVQTPCQVPSGVGKTVATQQLARHLGVSHLQVDDVRLALQEFTSAEQYPDLHHLEVALGAGSLSTEAICHGLIRVGEVLAAPLATIIAHHVVVAGVGPVIIEGDGVTPQLATKTDFAGQKFFGGLRLADQVRSIFIIEPEEDVILANMRARVRAAHTGFVGRHLVLCGLPPPQCLELTRCDYAVGLRAAARTSWPVVPPNAHQPPTRSESTRAFGCNVPL